MHTLTLTEVEAALLSRALASAEEHDRRAASLTEQATRARNDAQHERMRAVEMIARGHGIDLVQTPPARVAVSADDAGSPTLSITFADDQVPEAHP